MLSMRIQPMGAEQFYIYYYCNCGIIFRSENDEFPNTMDYDHKRTRYERERYEYIVYTYFPYIEELTFGRKMLEIGYYLPWVMRKAKDRGWIVSGIELDPMRQNEKDIEILKGDFLSYDFKSRKFDLIMLNHVVEHFENWQRAMMKVHELLRPEGIIFISSPDVCFLHKYGPAAWYWGDASHRVMFKRTKFQEESERLGFHTVLCRGNESKRFPHQYDFHYIGQKRYYDEPYIGGHTKGIDFEAIKKLINN